MYNLSLAQRDLYLVHIESQIENKRKLLLDKQKMLRETSKQNEYLGLVMKDYQKYYDYIIKQKRDQIRAMSLLKEYIDDLITTGKMTDVDLENAKNEQKTLLNEMSTIKGDLDELVAQE